MPTEKDCFDSFYSAVKSGMTKKSARIIYKKIIKNEDIEGNIKEIQDLAKIQKNRRVYQNVKKELKMIATKRKINKFHNAAEGLDAFANGIESNIEGSRDSISNHIKTKVHSTASRFLSMLHKSKVYDTFENIKNDAELGAELEKEGTSERPEITKLAKIIKTIRERLRLALNNENADIFKNDEFISSLKHNSQSMQSTTGNSFKDLSLRTQLLAKHKGNWPQAMEEYKAIAYKRWKDFIRPRIDDAKTFEDVPDNKIEDFLKGSYDGLTTGVFKTPYSETGLPSVIKNLADKVSAERKIFFKTDGKSWVSYNKQYGYGSIHDAVLVEFEESARALAFMERMGSNPSGFFNELVDWAQKQSRGISGADKHIKLAKNGMKTYLRQYDFPTMGMSGTLMNNFRMWQYATKLGNQTLSAIPDLSNMASGLRMHNIPTLEVYKTGLTSLAKGLPKGEMKDLALLLNVYGKGSMGAMFDRFGATVGKGFLARAVKLQDKLTVINRWDGSLRSSAGTMLSKALTQKLSLEWESLPEAEQRTLKISNIGKNEWNVYKNAQDRIDTFDHKKFLTPDIADKLTDNELNEYIKNKGDEDVLIKKPAEARKHLREALQLYFIDQTNYAKIMPDESDIALMRMGVDPNTIPGKVWGLLTMFKSFSVAQTRRTAGRFLYGGGAQNIYEALFQGKGDLKGMAHWMVNTLPMSYLSIASKAVAMGMEPPSLSDKKTLLKIFEPLSFTYGETMFSILNEGKVFQSPVGSTLEDIINLGKDIAQGKNISKRALAMASYNVPVIKTFYTNVALQHLVFNSIMDRIDPTYLMKKQLKAEKQGINYLISPTQYNL